MNAQRRSCLTPIAASSTLVLARRELLQLPEPPDASSDFQVGAEIHKSPNLRSSFGIPLPTPEIAFPASHPAKATVPVCWRPHNATVWASSGRESTFVHCKACGTAGRLRARRTHHLQFRRSHRLNLVSRVTAVPNGF